MTDPLAKAMLHMARGRGATVMTPGWGKILESMGTAAHPGYLGQRAFARCRRQGAIARAGRGGGKSFGMLGRFHAVSAANPKQSAVFVTISTERSRDILSPAVNKYNDLFNVGIVEKRADKLFEWPNGFKLLYRGCKDTNECNKRRGTPWAAAAWDECASIADKLLAYDIHECVEPRLVDLNGLWFAGGTPGPIPKGYWHDLSSGEGGTYPIFSWDARHNVHMPNVLKFFADTLQRMQGVPDRKKWPSHCTSILDLINDESCWKLLPASFVREYLGQWVLDLRALIYRITPKNSYSELPITPDYWTIGVDLGAHGEETPDLDHAAVSVAASHSSLPNIWIVESVKLSDITVDSLAAYLLEKLKQYPQANVHIDSASAGKIMERTYQKMGVSIQSALKGPKLRRIQIVQSAIRNGNLQLHLTRCMDARKEATALVWDDDRKNHSERCDDDAWDSILMAAVPHHGDYRPEAIEPPVGSEEWNQRQEMAEYEQALADSLEQAGIDDALADVLRMPGLRIPDNATLPPWAQPWRRAA